jgi:hypothetical protein
MTQGTGRDEGRGMMDERYAAVVDFIPHPPSLIPQPGDQAITPKSST